MLYSAFNDDIIKNLAFAVILILLYKEHFSLQFSQVRKY